MENEPVVIIDNGSGYLKIGFSNQPVPQETIPALVGRFMLRTNTIVDNPNGLKPIMYGDEAIPYSGLLELSHPITTGEISNPEDLSELWKYCFEEKLKIKDYTERKIIISEAPLNPIQNKKTMCDLLFDKFGFAKLNIEPQAKLALYSQGKSTGIVLDSGDGVSHVIPISNGMVLQHNIKRLNIAGRDITKYLIRLLQRK